MEVLVLLIVVSLSVVVLSVLFFIWTVREGTHEHADRLVLLPLADDSQEDSSDDR